MVDIHKKIKNFSGRQVLFYIDRLSSQLNDQFLRFESLPRYTVDLSGAPFNIDILRYALHSIIECNKLSKVEMVNYMFNSKSKDCLLDEDLLTDYDYWISRLNKILIHANKCVTITYENNLYGVYPSVSLMRIPEIRQLKSKIEFKQNKNINGVFFDNVIVGNTGSVHIGNVYNGSDNDGKNYTSGNYRLQIESSIRKGDISTAISIIDESLNSISSEMKHSGQLIIFRFKVLKSGRLSGTLLEENYKVELMKIASSCLEFASNFDDSK